MARPFWLAWLWLRAVSGQRRPLRSDLLPQIFSIQPRGGPVIGGTQITITGQDLNSASMQCVFGDPGNGEDLSKSSCKYDTTAPQAVQGHYCLCLAPAADYRFGEFVSGASELQVALHVHCMYTACKLHALSTHTCTCLPGVRRLPGGAHGVGVECLALSGGVDLHNWLCVETQPAAGPHV